ncbi:MAG: hypothetical protein R2830_17795 [Saprospiraceae bacterium]
MTALPITKSPAANLVRLKPVNRQPQIKTWLEDLEFYEKEVAFYCQMLRIGIRNGRGDNQPLFYELMHEFAEIRDLHLPEIKRLAIPVLGNETAQDEAFTLQSKLESLKQDLRNLKLKAFPLLPEIQQIIIW